MAFQYKYRVIKDGTVYRTGVLNEDLDSLTPGVVPPNVTVGELLSFYKHLQAIASHCKLYGIKSFEVERESV